jgi:gluconolactonase
MRVPHASLPIVLLAGCFTAPVWRPEEVLWFSDVQDNVVRSLTPAGAAKVIIRNDGGTVSAPPGAFIGPNGMIADQDGAVLLCQHGDRRSVRIGKDMTTTS